MAERRPIVNPAALAEHVNTDTLNVGQGPVFVEQASSLATPASGYGVVYAKTDGKLYFKNDAGTETDLTATGGGGTDPVIREYTANDTWTKPTASNFWGALVLCIGAGGGGGSGRRSADLTNASGGGGGAGPSMAYRFFRVGSLPSASYNIVVGSGGAGGAARTTNDTNGSNGNNGGNTTFGSTLVVAVGGNGGLAGQAATIGNAGPGTSAGSTPARGPFALSGVGGGNSSVLTGGGTPVDGFIGNNGMVAGGGGGAFSNANAQRTSGAGSGIYDVAVLTAGPAGGAIDGGAGTNGTSNVANNILFDIDNTVTNAPGTGGSGGGCGDTAGTIAGGAGGNGGRCAGGGGGGASRNGANSGAGGTGGDGLCYVVEYYGA